ncbi:MAG: large-conductance mechanosensitive channel protein MscL [Succinivibrio sp.]|nr:large-conductance mechanosensitive channel protein MscL [Succinivibrio sp.]
MANIPNIPNINIKEKGFSFLKEFREFAMRGNVIDMAVGVVIGTAFGKIVSSLVSDIIMPIIGILVGNVDFKDLGITLQEKTADQDAIVLGYGAFIQTIFDFVIIAFSIFVAIKLLYKLKNSVIKEKEAEEEKPAEPTPEVALLTEIRDLLKNK